MAHLFLATSLYISIEDLRSHRISHKSLALLAIPSIYLIQPSNVLYIVIALVILVLLLFSSDVGGGDIKLIALLILTQGKVWLAAEAIPTVLGVAVLLLIVERLRYGSWPLRIPLAPVILAPILSYYLVM